MKSCANYFLGLVVTLLVAGELCAPSHLLAKGGGDVEVLTYNIRTAAANDGGEANWWARREEVMRLITRHHPVILALQEADPQQHDFILNKLNDPQKVWRSIGRNQILYRVDILKVEADGLLILSPDVWGQRTASWVRFKRHSDQKSFLFVNTHWGVSSESQIASAAIIRDQLKEVAGGWEESVIFMGDFNAEPDHESIQLIGQTTPLESYFNDATFGNWQVSPYRQLDYVFGVNLDAANCELDFYREGELPPSDHFPISCHIRL